jgi:hypothetical protein
VGKPIAAAMTESDEVEFLRFFRSTTEIEILEWRSSAIDSIRVGSFGPRNGHRKYYIWNNGSRGPASISA